MQKLAAIRLRGKFNIREDIEDTLTLLGLKRKNTCVILEANKYNLGMLKKAKDYITYGEISEEILKKLLEKKNPEKQTDKKIIFRLPNPKKGFKSIKKGFGQGGDLGYRGDKINELLERIIDNF
jgi:large subunit ribosomal protein L30